MFKLTKAITFSTLIAIGGSAYAKCPTVSLDLLLDSVVATNDMTGVISNKLGIRLRAPVKDNYPLLSGPLRLLDVRLKNLAVDISAIRRKQFMLADGVGCKKSKAMIQKYSLKLSSNNRSHTGLRMVYSGTVNNKFIELQTDGDDCFRRLEVAD